MKLKNPFLFWLISLFALGNLGDIISTFFILDGEMNPLYVYLGNWGLVIGFILKLFLVGLFIYVYNKNEHPNNISYFLTILILVYGTAMLFLAVASNASTAMHPEDLAAMKDISADVKVSAYSKVITLLYFIPVGMALLSFWIYDRSLKRTKIIGK